MKSSYTGGLYSFLRFHLGVLAAFYLLGMAILADAPLSLTVIPQLVVGVLAGLFVAVGAPGRMEAITCATFVVAIPVQLGFELDASMVLLSSLLLLHACTPLAPYGSWTARGRIDPRGDWHMPTRVWQAQWILLSAAYAYLGLSSIDSSTSGLGWLPPSALIAFGPLALVRKLRPWLWLVFLLGDWLAPLAPLKPDTTPMWLLFHWFLFDPAWIKPAKRNEHTTVFYDGTCGFCHRSVRFLLSEDAYQNLRFAPLQGSTFQERLDGRDLKIRDSLIVFTPEGRLLDRSDAIIEAMERLGGAWRVIAIFARIIPAFLRDGWYDLIGRRRMFFFARPKQLCPILPPDLTSRFLP